MAVTDEMVCFALYAAHRATSQTYRALLAPWDLTYPQYLVLATLWNEGPQSVRDLGDAMQLDSGTLSPLLRRMEERDLVRRERSAADARVVDVHPTDRGLALRAELCHIPAAIASGMGLADAADAEGLLQRLHAIEASMHAAAPANHDTGDAGADR
ncbi:MarR family winged helix-turn-helix transcriptional regulator [Agrococcus jejuensis]|uniref:DNA-binding transcriptional regulator, MarR family n=1 Tax=Agrococcus jejuensis TaxID=399736 RepID=A0A1G8CVB1_9MICO|nr:MarR family transcriptional regulator [Agrococcus jejuensis]SDH49441.1 DNA-binding transcriptional regulator, MarR family [Agrococcus jejuensis]